MEFWKGSSGFRSGDLPRLLDRCRTHLAPGGQLLFTGTNSVGVTSAVKRLAKAL